LQRAAFPISLSDSSSVSVRNSIFYEFEKTAITVKEKCTADVTNCTFFTSSTNNAFGPVVNYLYFDPTSDASASSIINCISNVPYVCSQANGPAFSYNTCRSPGGFVGCSGEGVLSTDPEFVNPSGGDLHLQPTSPAIDAGDPTDDYSLEPTCDGNNTRINMGAYGNTPEATCKQQAAVMPRAQRMTGQAALVRGHVYSLRGRYLGSASSVQNHRSASASARPGVYVLKAEQGGYSVRMLTD